MPARDPRRSPGARRGVFAALTTSLLAVAALGASAEAIAPLEVVFHATIDNCISGTAVRGDPGTLNLTVQLRTASNGPLDSQPVTTDTDGTFQACFSTVVLGGRRLRAFDGLTTEKVSFTIPALTVTANRITDVVKGSGPRDKQLRVRLYDCSRLTFECVSKVTRFVDINSAGTYQKDFSSSYDARGFDEARVRYTSSAGHTFEIVRVFPWMAAVVFDNLAFGEVNPGRQVKLRLRSSGGSLLDTKTKTGNPVSGDFGAHFDATIRAGREVSGDFASDAHFVIPDTSASVAGGGAVDQLLTVHCLPNRKLKVDPNPGANMFAVADSHGEATINVTEALGYDLTTETFDVVCQASSGDLIFRSHPSLAPAP